VPIEKNPSAISRMSKVIQAVEEWAVGYEQKNRYECAGGTVVPKVNIGAIRGGVPWKITKTVQQCAIYVDVRITPAQEPLDVREELRRVVADAGVPGEVELYVFRPAFEADEKKAAPLRDAIRGAHAAIVGGEPNKPPLGTSSMWRDLNCFNEMRIPSLTYGPGVSVGGGVFRMPIKNLVTGSKLYVMTALDLCNQDRK
jgi:acetylornithine deacetylase/succinyl-diaminopimelate desuccinylase-like protein